MAILTPNSQYKINGVLVNEKIIPDGTGTVWKDATKAKRSGFSAGSLYKKQAKLCGWVDSTYVKKISSTSKPSQISIRSKVKIKSSAITYYQNGPKIPDWVKSVTHVVTQVILMVHNPQKAGMQDLNIRTHKQLLLQI